ncbi:hypothetical protein J4439_04095 [Candidatus Woesearchaeota archaeon]|nr:hypothetical protein [Candidatus Woesearchaeota archaeon]
MREEVRRYIEERRAQGLADDAIRELFLKAGYHPAVVEGFFEVPMPAPPLPPMRKPSALIGLAILMLLLAALAALAWQLGWIPADILPVP